MDVKVTIRTSPDDSNSSRFKNLLVGMSDTRRVILYSLGIFLCYFYYGILQEKITRVPYGENNEKFTFAVTLVCAQCIINSLFAISVIKLQYGDHKDTTTSTMYITCSMSYVGAMIASNTALRFVNYPTQVLGKSCKPIPVMILGSLIAKKRYGLKKFISVLLIVFGVAIFMYKDKGKSTDKNHRFGWGELLLLASLTMDGITGACQEKMRADFKTTSHHMMLAINKWAVILLTTCVIVTGELWQFTEFCFRFPFVIWNILTLSIMSALGQNFIFLTVSNFGPLPCSIATTTRKFFTILFSVIFFGNELLPRQWFAVTIVFTGLALDAYRGRLSLK